ncbi:MAG: HEPN domain-containing protein [Actinomycetes bacterium]
MDDGLRELVGAWLTKASHDLRAAERLVPNDDEGDYEPLFSAAAFHLQQAAEKTLKAYLASRSVRFANIHDLSKLLALAETIEVDFSQLADAAETLAPCAVEIRYPGDWDDLTRDEYSEVKHAAEEIVELVTERIETDQNQVSRTNCPGHRRAG